MRKLLALTGAAFGLVLSTSFSALAGDVATRCGNYGCDRVDCHDDGDHCTRYSDYDNYYNGYTNGGYTNGYYGGYDDYAQSPSYDDNGYYGGYDRNAAPAYDNGYYGGYDRNAAQAYNNGYYGGYDSYGAHLVCDSDGTRCYTSYAPYWDYHEYYRVHGYRWDH